MATTHPKLKSKNMSLFFLAACMATPPKMLLRPYYHAKIKIAGHEAYAKIKKIGNNFLKWCAEAKVRFLAADIDSGRYPQNGDKYKSRRKQHDNAPDPVTRGRLGTRHEDKRIVFTAPLEAWRHAHRPQRGG
jgi:hypothetical protein